MAIAGTGIDRPAFASGFSLEDTGASQFQPHIGDRFTVFPADGSGRVRVRLAKVTELPPSRDYAQFTIVFHGPATRPIGDGIHEFLHPSLGSFSIFISSNGAAGEERCAYQACFTRRVRT